MLCLIRNAKGLIKQGFLLLPSFHRPGIVSRDQERLDRFYKNWTMQMETGIAIIRILIQQKCQLDFVCRIYNCRSCCSEIAASVPCV
jgi:hypothetical protein